jgi:hypothetical protein
MSDFITLDEIELPADMQWTDEFSWSTTKQNTTRAVNGSQIVMMNRVQAGQPITLEGFFGGKGSKDNYALVTRSVVNALKAKESAGDPGTTMTLTFSDGRTFDVIFRYDDGDNAIEATGMKPIDPPLDADLYLLKLKLMTV